MSIAYRHTDYRLLALVMVMLTVLLCACDRSERPNPDALHGVVRDGKTFNEITLFNDSNNNRPKLRFAPEMGIMPYTAGWNDRKNPVPILRGWATEVKVGVEITKDFQVRATGTVEPSQELGGVLLSFIASHTESPVSRQNETDYIAKFIAESPIANTRHELGLYEYMITNGHHVSKYEYLPMDKNFLPHRSMPFRISCGSGGDPTEKIPTLSMCGASFKHASGTAVTLSMTPSLLPHWREVYMAIDQFTSSLIQQ